jgi:hypothetical protein
VARPRCRAGETARLGSAKVQGPRHATGQGASPTGSDPLMVVAMS